MFLPRFYEENITTFLCLKKPGKMKTMWHVQYNYNLIAGARRVVTVEEVK